MREKKNNFFPLLFPIPVIIDSCLCQKTQSNLVHYERVSMHNFSYSRPWRGPRLESRRPQTLLKAESVLMNEMENYVQPYSEMFSSADWCPQSDWPFLMKHWASIDPIVHLFRLGVLLTSAYTSLVLGDE